MGQALKYVCLVLTFLAGTVFPLPECYLTKPNCPQRQSAYCPALNHRPTAQAAAAGSPCRACPHSGPATGAKAPAPARGQGGLLMTTLSPKFVLEIAPALPSPFLVSLAALPEPAAPPASPGLGAPKPDHPPGPIPLLQRKQTLLI